MERRLTISILNTETRSGGLFRRSYTVILTQVYLIEALIDYSSSYKVYKRYSEFSLFALSLMPRIKKHHIALPNFPEKNLNNGTKTITIRKEMLQNWLQNISNHCVLEKRLCKFLQVDYKLILTKRPHLAIDDYYVLEYLQKIKKEQGKKLSILKDFSEKFLCRRRSLQNETMKKLISSILPLCAEEVISGFALDFITKISTREYFLEYEKIKNELVRMPMEEIRGMHLENFFLGKKFTQGQLQAYNLVCLLMEMSPKDIRENEDFYGKVTEMLNGNIEAINMVLNWEIMDIGEGVSVKSQKPINAGLWQVLSKTDKSCISYKYFSSELHLDIEFTISASMDKMISLFTVPAERKKWDLKLSEIELTDDSQYYFDYIFEKTHKIIPLKVEISEDPNYSKITFTMEKNNGFSSEIHIEQYESIQFDKQSLGSENTMIFSERSFKKDEDCDSLKVSWKLKCTGQYIDIYKSDIIQECMHLCKSIKLLIDAAENRDVSECHRGSFFIDKACSKKLLRRSIQF